MASFDFVESVSRACHFVWEQRVDVVRLSLMVLVIKILSFVSFVAFGMQDAALRQGLLLLPVFLLEGRVIATLVIMAVQTHRVQNSSRGSGFFSDEDISRNAKAAMIVYVLTKLALSFLMGSAYEGQQGAPDVAMPEPTFQTVFVAIFILLFLIWAFRFLWIYVAVAMGYSISAYLKRFRAFSDSFSFLGVWILCFVPVMLLLLLLSEFYSISMSALGIGVESVVFEGGLTALQAVVDYVLSLVSSLAVAYGIYSVFNNENQKTELW